LTNYNTEKYNFNIFKKGLLGYIHILTVPKS